MYSDVPELAHTRIGCEIGLITPLDESESTVRSATVESRHARVLHLLTTYSLAAGAAENTVITAKGLPRDRFKVFLASRPGQGVEGITGDNIAYLPVPHLVRGIHPAWDLLAFWEIYRLCRRWRFDVVHTHNAKDGVLGRWAARLAGVPVIVHTIHNPPFRASRYRVINSFYEWIERLTALVTDGLLAVSRENVRDFLDRHIGNVSQYRVVYSGLEFAKYRLSTTQAAARESLGLPLETPVVGWFGRLNYQKDPITFVRASRIVAAKLPEVRFVMCGSDPLEEDLSHKVHDLIRELQLGDYIRFLGFRDDLPLVFRAVDCVMHSSRYEGMGRLVCEALLCDRPVAATNVDGVREVIVSGQRGGLLVAPEDPNALAKATLTLLQDPALARALASSGRKWVEEHLSAERMILEIATIYSGLLNSH